MATLTERITVLELLPDRIKALETDVAALKAAVAGCTARLDKLDPPPPPAPPKGTPMPKPTALLAASPTPTASGSATS